MLTFNSEEIIKNTVWQYYRFGWIAIPTHNDKVLIYHLFIDYHFPKFIGKLIEAENKPLIDFEYRLISIPLGLKYDAIIDYKRFRLSCDFIRHAFDSDKRLENEKIFIPNWIDKRQKKGKILIVDKTYRTVFDNTERFKIIEETHSI